MMGKTLIDWADYSWNPVTGCTKISPACQHCYAESIARRFAGTPSWPNGFRVTTHPERLEQPIHWRKPGRVFLCSAGDLFHEDVPDEFIERVFGVMALCQQHTFQVLTKRPDRMLRWFTEEIPLSNRAEQVAGWAEHVGRIVWDGRGSDPDNYATVPGHGDVSNRRVWPGWPLPNVWLGVTAENQEMADQRTPVLLQVPAAKRFVSIEPMLGPVDLGLNTATCHSSHRLPSRWVRLSRAVYGDWPIGHRVKADAGIYRAESNRHGALSVSTPEGLLGIKPSELELYEGNGPHMMDAHVERDANGRFISKRAAGHLLDGQAYREFPEARS